MLNKIKKLMLEYADIYSNAWSNLSFKHPIANMVRNDITNDLRAVNFLNSDIYKVKASCGTGRFTAVPWIAIFDLRITSSAQKGIYVVYLLNKDSKELYLTLAHAVTRISISELKEKARFIQKQLGIDYCEPIHSGSDEYDAGCIFSKKYTVEDLNDEEAFLTDLKFFIDLYSRYQQYNEKGIKLEISNNKKYKDCSAKATFEKKSSDTYETTISTENSGEQTMTAKEQIEAVKNYIAAKGFNYDGALIENFYLSLKSKPFVILAGTSGTGKTRLVRLFAEAINAEYKLVAVRPDWSDSSDLFGHVDLNQKFIPGAVIDFVKKAELNPAKPYFLCLDEMNLARVEYYMSDILSAIETRRFDNKGLTTDPVFDSVNYGNDTAAAERYGDVVLPGNLYIIGTVNMDETTFPFSKKVLDRANTIEFSHVDLSALPAFDSEDPESFNASNNFLVSEYIKLNDCSISDRDYISSISEKLAVINDILKMADAHVGYRVRDEIVFYMLNNKKAELLDENTAFDNQIMQKILPRVHGSSSVIKTMLEELGKHCESDKYVASAEKIKFMIKRYEDDGFTSYWL